VPNVGLGYLDPPPPIKGWAGAMLDERDRTAMELAIEQQRALGPVEAAQIDAFLKERGFAYAGSFAASSQQSDNLKLKPCEWAPAWLWAPDWLPSEVDAILAEGEDGKRYSAAKLARRMLDAGVSLYHPNPEAALREAARQAAGN
jgi:hypothetical protein